MGRTLLSTSRASALSIVRFADPIGAAEAIVGIGLAVAATNRLETLAVLADNAKLGHGHAGPGLCARLGAGLGGTFSSGWFAPQALIARGSGGAAARLPGGHCVSLVVRHRDDCQHHDEYQSKGRSE